jgi:hypothetical protein
LAAVSKILLIVSPHLFPSGMEGKKEMGEQWLAEGGNVHVDRRWHCHYVPRNDGRETKTVPSPSGTGTTGKWEDVTGTSWTAIQFVPSKTLASFMVSQSSFLHFVGSPGISGRTF